jgi:hypothetical protein
MMGATCHKYWESNNNATGPGGWGLNNSLSPTSKLIPPLVCWLDRNEPLTSNRLPQNWEVGSLGKLMKQPTYWIQILCYIHICPCNPPQKGARIYQPLKSNNTLYFLDLRFRQACLWRLHRVFQRSFTTFKAYINLFRIYLQCFELS